MFDSLDERVVCGWYKTNVSQCIHWHDNRFTVAPNIHLPRNIYIICLPLSSYPLYDFLVFPRYFKSLFFKKNQQM